MSPKSGVGRDNWAYSKSGVGRDNFLETRLVER